MSVDKVNILNMVKNIAEPDRSRIQHVFNRWKSGIWLPNLKDKIYVVRISETNVTDYNIMKNTFDEGDVALWDKDKKNTIKPENWLGFIIGSCKDPVVELYKVENELPVSARPSHWDEKQYTSQNVTVGVNERGVISFDPRIKINVKWNDWKKIVNYSPNCKTWMPRGTTTAINPFPNIEIISTRK
jgi:hypothetical protein